MNKTEWDTIPYNGNFGFAISEEYKGEKIIPFKIPTFFGNQFEFLKEKLTQEELWKLALLINSSKEEQNEKFIEKSNFDNEQYKADLQSAYDCGFVAGQKYMLEELTKDIEKEQKGIQGKQTDFYVGKSNGYTDIWEKIQKCRAELKGE